MRELTDGRLLISDVRERRIVAIDWERQIVTPVGRVGDGPGEYRSPRHLIALAGDTTLLADSEARRWQLLVGHRFAGQLSTSLPLRVHYAGSPVVGADASGRFAFLAAHPSDGDPMKRLYTQSPEMAESLSVVVITRDGGRVDTMAALAGRPYAPSTNFPRVDRGMKITWVLTNPLLVPDQALLHVDGWLAIARRDPYRVDWIRPDGRIIRGTVVARPPVRVTAEERQFAARVAWSQVPPPAIDPTAVAGWPEFVPPFTLRALTPMADGRVLVQRMPTLAAPRPQYDLFDRTGVLVSTLELPEDERILGIGRNWIFTVVTDTDDLQYVARYPLRRQ